MTGWLGPAEWEAVRLSLKVAFWATLLTLPVGVWLGWLLARGQFRGHAMLSAAVHIPLVLPPVVTGYLLLLTFSPAAPLGALLETLGLPLAFRWTGAVLAASVMSLPLMVRPIRLAFEAVDPRLEEAAATLGASRLRVFLTVTLPLARTGLVAGAVMAFAKALGEFGATITFVANIPGETRTVPSAIYAFLQVPGGDAAALRLVVVALILSLGAVVASELLTRKTAR
ncbi:molybdate ABC transporter permease subunit [Pseudaestuariivita sp.]|uniref:molybdate ABC transporter permease subunit n=1 Tax=Pseudaestuariivita sp. TaxID=2211669 RepID=UPI0040591BC0